MDIDLNTPIGVVVKAWRTYRGWSVTELARRASEDGNAVPVSRGYISEVERNKIHQPGEDLLLRLASALGIPVSYLLMRTLPSQVGKAEPGAGRGAASQPAISGSEQSKRQPLRLGSGARLQRPEAALARKGKRSVLVELLKETEAVERKLSDIRSKLRDLLKQEDEERA